jgi:tetratricopeptide (TPR) repeat protein
MLIRRVAHQVAVAIAVALFIAACQPGISSVEDVRRIQAGGDYASSIEPLRAMLVERPESSELQYLLGVALRHTGAPSLAIWPLRKAIEDPEWFWPAALELVQSAAASDNIALAIRVTTDMIERDDTRFEAWLLRAEAHIAGRKDYEEALADVETALELRPESYAARLTQASTLLMLERPDEAEAIIGMLEPLAETTGLGDAERAKLCVVKSSLLDERGRIGDAKIRLDSCLEHFPDDTLVVETAVGLLEKWGERGRAQEVLSRGIEREPGNLAYRISLAQRLQLAGKESEAETLLREFAEGEGSPNERRQAWVTLGDHFLLMERYAEAAGAVGHALELGPEPADAEILTYADLLAMAGEHDEARKAAARLKRLEYRDLIEARILLQEEQPGRALEHLDRVLKIWPDNAAARYYAARAAEQTGDVKRAIAEYRASIRADAGMTDAGLRLARIHLARRELQPAMSAAKYHLDAHPGDPEAALLIGQGLLRQQQPIPQALMNLLGSSGARSRWIALQADELAKSDGPEAAIAYLEQFEAAGIKEDQALRSLIDVLVNADRTGDAKVRLTAASSRRPPSSLVFELEAVVLRAEGKLEEAQARLTKALVLNPHNESALRVMGKVLLELGSLDDAITYFDRASVISKTPWQPNHDAAAALFERGHVEEARSRLEESLREHTFDTDSLVLLGEICLGWDACRDQVPTIARTAANLGQQEASKALEAALAASLKPL